MLYSVTDSQGDPSRPGGCLMINGAMVCNEANDAIRRDLIAGRAGGEAALRARLPLAKTEGELPADSCPADVARYITIVMHGIAAQATSGTGCDLRAVADIILRNWPA
jgi:hypothetical protein